MGKRSELSIAQRIGVVLVMLRREEPVSVLARRYGVSENTLHRWKDDFVRAGESALAYGRGKSKVEPGEARIKELERDLAKRDQVIGELTIANRILKKTADGSY